MLYKCNDNTPTDSLFTICSVHVSRTATITCPRLPPTATVSTLVYLIPRRPGRARAGRPGPGPGAGATTGTVAAHCSLLHNKHGPGSWVTDTALNFLLDTLMNTQHVHYVENSYWLFHTLRIYEGSLLNGRFFFIDIVH